MKFPHVFVFIALMDEIGAILKSIFKEKGDIPVTRCPFSARIALRQMMHQVMGHGYHF